MKMKLLINYQGAFILLGREERWRAYRDMGVSGTPLGIRGREDSVDKNKSANNLSTKAITFGVTRTNHIGTTI
jgi:hypothetical protein